jgi:hypothetical protein
VYGAGCLLPDGRHVINVPVRGNLALLGLGPLNPGTSWAGVATVTWQFANGTSATFTDQNTAVPFAGAPAWPVRIEPPAQNYAQGNGRLAGQTLAYWQSIYGVLRRPQSALDRSSAGSAERAARVAIVPGLTRVLLDADRVQVFLTLSAVNPGAGLADRRYTLEVSDTTSQSGSTAFSPGPGDPVGVFIPGTAALLEYSVVPDDVLKVQWHLACQPACPQLATVTLRADGNIVDSTLPGGFRSIQVRQVDWYVHGRARPLRLGG